MSTPGRVVNVRDPQGAKEPGGTYVFVHPYVDGLAALADLVAAGRLTPHVQFVYDLDAVGDAVIEASAGKVAGKGVP